MPVAAAITVAGSVASAGIGYMGATSAADKQAQAASNALGFQQSVFNYNKDLYGKVYGDNQSLFDANKGLNQQNQDNLRPWIDTGTSALYSLRDLYGLGPSGTQGTTDGFNKFTDLPAYQFPMQQGMLALTRNLNAQGKNMSGAQMREAQQFGQGLASSYFMSNYVNPLQSLAGGGLNAAGTAAQSNNSLMSANVGAAQANAGLTGSFFNSSNQGGQQIGNSFGNIGQAQASGIVGGTNAITGGLQGGANSLAMYSMLSQGGGGLSPTYGNGTGSQTGGQSGWSNFGTGGTMYPTFG